MYSDDFGLPACLASLEPDPSSPSGLARGLDSYGTRHTVHALSVRRSPSGRCLSAVFRHCGQMLMTDRNC